MPPRVVELEVAAPKVTIHGDLTLPSVARGVVVFAHGSGSGRTSPRNRKVARALEGAGIGTFLVDLLSEEEAEIDAVTRQFRFDIPRLGERVLAAIDTLNPRDDPAFASLGLYGASTGGAAALIAAAERAERIGGLVLRGARSDLADAYVDRVRAPTLFLVGEHDPAVREWNEASRRRMSTSAEVHVVAGASHLFEESGALAEVARWTRDWFGRTLAAR